MPARERLLDQLGLREALGRDEAGQHEADVDAVLALLGPQRVRPAGERELRGAVGAACRARATRPAVEATLTIAEGALARSSGSSASVRRTWASKLIAIVRRTFS